MAYFTLTSLTLEKSEKKEKFKQCHFTRPLTFNEIKANNQTVPISKPPFDSVLLLWSYMAYCALTFRNQETFKQCHFAHPFKLNKQTSTVVSVVLASRIPGWAIISTSGRFRDGIMHNLAIRDHVNFVYFRSFLSKFYIENAKKRLV